MSFYNFGELHLYALFDNVVSDYRFFENRRHKSDIHVLWHQHEILDAVVTYNVAQNFYYTFGIETAYCCYEYQYELEVQMAVYKLYHKYDRLNLWVDQF